MSLQKELEENNISENEKVQIYSEIDFKYKTRGAILRSKSLWHNEGEKNTKYFLTWKNDISIKKNIKHLTLANDNVVNTDSEILEEAKSFYQNLYSSANTQPDTKEENMFFPDGNTLILNEQE